MEWAQSDETMTEGPSRRMKASQQLASMKAVLNNVKIEPYLVTSQIVAALMGELVGPEESSRNLLKAFISRLEKDPETIGEGDAVALVSIKVHLTETWIQPQPLISSAPLPQDAVAKEGLTTLSNCATVSVGQCTVLPAHIDSLRVTAVPGTFPNYQYLFIFSLLASVFSVPPQGPSGVTTAWRAWRAPHAPLIGSRHGVFRTDLDAQAWLGAR